MQMARLLSFDAYELGVIEGISNRRNEPTYFEEDNSSCYAGNRLRRDVLGRVPWEIDSGLEIHTQVVHWGRGS